VPTIHDPVAFHIFDLPIRWYGLFILTGILVGVAVLRHLAALRGLDPEFALDAAPIVVVIAVIGARLYYLLLRNEYYRSNPDELVSLQLQGLTIHGALVAGMLAFAFLCHRRHQPLLTWADVVIAAVPIGQAIGRLGNWANQEAFGTPSSLPWAVHIDPGNRPAEYVSAATFHPTFMYEGILNLGVAAVLIWMVLRVPASPRLRDGDVLAAYLVLYGLVRLAVESVRSDSLYIGPWPAAYWLSGALIVLGIALALGRRVGPLAKPDIGPIVEPTR
jgi:phosphatidylglycerol---prolipoprotein diacylglyceryl transferase